MKPQDQALATEWRVVVAAPVTISPGMTAPHIAPPVCDRRGEKRYSAAIQAEIKRGEAGGFYVKRRENIKARRPPRSWRLVCSSYCASRPSRSV